MQITYEPKSNEIEIYDEKENNYFYVKMDELLESLPKNIEIVRLHHCLNEIRKLRLQKIRNNYEYQEHILELTVDERKSRELQKEAILKGDFKTAKAYAELVKSILAEKNTANELRHNTKLLAIEEGRLMAILSKLEV